MLRYALSRQSTTFFIYRTVALLPPKRPIASFLPCIGAKKSTQTLFVQSFSTTLRVMDVRAENRGRPHQKVRRNFLTLGHPGVRVRNVRGKSGLKSFCLCCFSFPDCTKQARENPQTENNLPQNPRFPRRKRERETEREREEIDREKGDR